MSVPIHVRIQDFCKTGSGGTPDRSRADYYGGDIPWVKSGELREGIICSTEEKITRDALLGSSAKMIPAGSLLIAMYGATVGRTAILGVDAATNQAVCNIRPDPDRCDVRYLFHFLQSRMKHFVQRAAGGAQPNISQGIIRETTVPLPALEEQRRIATILDRADALRQDRKRALELLDGLLDSLFTSMFGDPHTAEGRWDLADFAESCSDRTAAGGKIQKTEYAASGLFPVVDQGQSFIAGWSNQEKQVRRLVSPVVIFGDHTRIVKYVDFDFIVGADGAKVLHPTDKFNPLFFAELMRRMPIPDLGYSRHMRALKELRFPCPPMNLQTRFRDFAIGVSSEKLVAQRGSEQLDSLFAALKHRAFAGRL